MPFPAIRGIKFDHLLRAKVFTHRSFTQCSRLARHPSPSAHKWSHPPSSTTIADDDVASLSSEKLHALSLADLVKEGRPPLSEKALFSSANFTLSLLPIRLAHRIQALRNLPFIVVSNPNISTIYNNYLHSLSTLLPYKSRTISTIEDEIKFTNVLADLVETHSHTIPTLARGFLECRKYINSGEVTRFLDEHLRARIGTRLIAEQHIALHLSSQPHQNTHGEADPASSYIGVIDTALQPASIINSCGNFVSEICELKYGVRPTWIIDGEPGTTFAYVPVHLEYIITELLKNAFRATVESGRSHEPIVITIAAEPESPRGGMSRSEQGGIIAPIDSNSPIRPFEDPAPGVTIRIRDRGGGISPEVLPDIWSYSFTTFSDEDLPGGSGSMDALSALSGAGGEGSSIAGLGYGLPLGRAYAEYFGGGIAVQSLYGWGTDVYLRLKGLGKPRG
ncbi:related to branched-chain alpha-ketoacid dehydrogenase kinase, mitochondrial precursor [Rhynchosporium secalis]|uniref:Protein-serine/threonine kinase n=1 Tax=Rhynchosporium secalis TaxID=38038 RepID=A0A1E1LYZ2_RHYSE|nr:related to branched-chain alpha-ketoacid dehydrogenase kinase, mitochondrial precursor [Rhynchosporium secalis]